MHVADTSLSEEPSVFVDEELEGFEGSLLAAGKMAGDGGSCEMHHVASNLGASVAAPGDILI